MLRVLPPLIQGLVWRGCEMISHADFLRAAEIARLLGRSERTVRRWIRTKVVPSAKLGGARLVAKSELERLLRPALPDPTDNEWVP